LNESSIVVVFLRCYFFRYRSIASSSDGVASSSSSSSSSATDRIDDEDDDDDDDSTGCNDMRMDGTMERWNDGGRGAKSNIPVHHYSPIQLV
jgi:hypothetical protein